MLASRVVSYGALYTIEDEGNTASFQCPVSPSDGFTIQWRKDTGSLSGRVSLRLNGVMVISNITTEDAGLYICTAGSIYGSIQLGVNILVAPELSLRILNWNYTEAYKNRSSQEFITFERNFTGEMDVVYGDIPGYNGTVILNISSGSLRVKFGVLVRYTVNSSSVARQKRDDIELTITNELIVRAKTGYVESLQVDRSPQEFRTSSKPPAPKGFQTSGITSDGAEMTWSKPENYEYFRITAYRIRFWEHAQSDKDVTSDIRVTTFQLTGLGSGKLFNAHVFAVNSYGGGKESENVSFKTRGGSIPVWLIAVIVIVCVILVALLVLVIYCCRRRKEENKKRKKQVATDLEKGIEMTKWTSGPDYDEPGMLSISNATLDDEWIPCDKFPREHLTLFQELGSGAFGQVVKGELQSEDRKSRVDCAVKTLKGNAGPDEHQAFRQELDIMWHVGYHPNLINLIGACFDKGQLLIIVEYASDGCLLDLLKTERLGTSIVPLYQNMPMEHHTAPFSFNDRTRLSIMLDVATGMEYLVSKRCIHRDLAARNVLLTDGVAKVADFGLSRDIYQTGEYEKTTKGKLPIKWMAIESLETRKFTIESDVWSYGVLLWEIETNGLLPYGPLNYKEILCLLKEGSRLERPWRCSDELYELMTDCWEADPKARPTFTNLCEKLTLLLQNHQVQSGHREESHTYVNMNQDIAPVIIHREKDTTDRYVTETQV